MEIAYLEDDTIKLKTKKASFVIDPKAGTAKTSSDAILFLKKDSGGTGKVSDFRLVVNGPGEYELGGVKVSGQITGECTVYSFIAEGTQVLVGNSSALNKLAEKLQEHSVAVINLDEDLNQNVITAVEPRVAFLYGGRVEESIKVLGKDLSTVEKTKKASVQEGKLPDEMQVVVLT